LYQQIYIRSLMLLVAVGARLLYHRAMQALLCLSLGGNLSMTGCTSVTFNTAKRSVAGQAILCEVCMVGKAARRFAGSTHCRQSARAKSLPAAAKDDKAQTHQ
jgi:hypothetical protein